jgi:hypothetical protein
VIVETSIITSILLADFGRFLLKLNEIK